MGASNNCHSTVMILNQARMNAFSDGTGDLVSIHNASIGLASGLRNAILALWVGSSLANKPTEKEFTYCTPQILSTHQATGWYFIVWECVAFVPKNLDNRKSVAPPLSDLISSEQFMDIIPDLFPNIKRLYIAIQGDLLGKAQQRRYPKIRFGHYKTDGKYYLNSNAIVTTGITDKVDNMVRHLKPDVDFSVALPASIYAIHRRSALLQGLKVEQRHETGAVERYWRPLKNCLPRTGYWFCLGEKDVKRKRSKSLIAHKIVPDRHAKEFDVFFPGQPR
ncbi:hypothetical protein F53441_2997 [Fusarium austroafricanum]|uniref:Uncharacterized protein n=1 Tax=Fusarium austroafricanum TaxID=2364996 RepID=A0A8H4KRP3_9HYPO|nr:hypothetical protein F53441_2997 [Fusarium austroafricanum]